MSAFIQSRKIEYLVHFTRVANLPNILTHGLLGRTTLEESQIDVQVNDSFRFDYLPNGICCSISFPNYRMFYRMRCDNPDDDWAVLRLSAEILRTKQCVFCVENAASHEIAHADVVERTGLPALEAMFVDHEGMPSRAALRIPDNYTTNPQAEVLVLEPIEKELIIDALVDSKERIRNIQNLANTIRPFNGQYKFLHGKHYFDARQDYCHWK
jgi:hypothetical protein